MKKAVAFVLLAMVLVVAVIAQGWEYTVVVVNRDKNPFQGLEVAMQETLNYYGVKGWELVTVNFKTVTGYKGSETTDVYMVFRRPLTPP